MQKGYSSRGGTLSIFSAGTHLFSSPIYWGIILLIAVCSTRATAQAEVWTDHPYIAATGMDEYGVYVQLHLPVAYVAQGIFDYSIDGVVQVAADNGPWNDLFSVKPTGPQLAALMRKDQHLGSGFRAKSYDNAQAGWSNYTYQDLQTVVISNASQSELRFTRVSVRWYIPDALMGYELSFRITGERTAGVGGSGIPLAYTEVLAYEKENNVTAKRFASPIPSVKFSTALSAKADSLAVELSYDKAIGTEYDPVEGLDAYRFSHAIYPGGAVSEDASASHPGGAVLVPRLDHDTTVEVRSMLRGKDGHNVYTASSFADVHAIYPWPKSLESAYDSSSGTVSLSWHMPPTADYNMDQLIKGDRFQIERSTDPTFEDRDVTKTFQMDYSSSQSDYTLNDDLSEDNVQGIIYYRMRRDKTASDWEWNVVRTTQREIHMRLPTPSIADSVRLELTPAPQIRLSWHITEGVWPKGTQFIIRRYEKTESGQGYSDITLSREDMEKESYIDKNVSFCTHYDYAVFVKPGNPNYATPEPLTLPGDAIALDMGTISDLIASKGYYNDHVSLQWHSVGGFSNYVILRSATGHWEDAVQIATLPATSTASTNILYDDSKGTPGIYYTYYVLGAVDCGGVESKTLPLASIGFRTPTGTVYGRVTYESGQAVQGATVRLETSDQVQLGRSIYLDGSPKSYLLVSDLPTVLSDSAFTLEAWIKPDDQTPHSQDLFAQPGQYRLGFDADGKLYFQYGDQQIQSDYTAGTGSFIHVTAIHLRDSLKLIVNDQVTARQSISFQPVTGLNRIYIGRNSDGNSYRGFIDEIRVWNIALSDSQAIQDYTRLLTGGEKGLAAYWRFDETVSGQFFDLAHSGDQYHMNDGTMDPEAAVHSLTVPTAAQLGLKSFTDSSGNYMITGIPYVGVNGTTYSIAPRLGSHEFDPLSVTRLFASGSSTFTVNFQDISAYKVTGYIHYYNSTLPVKGVQFNIDGKPAQKGNGQIIVSDEEGHFEIYVPVGIHEVRAVKANHIFAAGGRIMDGMGHDLNYQNAISERILYDSTTVRFIGRVAAGSLQQALPLGHSLSRNNLGKVLSITLSSPNIKYLLTNSPADSTLTFDHLLPSETKDSSMLHHTRVVYQKDGAHVVIYPDAETGEFVADLLPEKFQIDEVHATGWGNILPSEGGAKPTLDLTNKFVTRSSVYTYADTLRQPGGTTQIRTYSDTAYFNDSALYILRINPTVTMAQLDANRNPLPYFGDSIYAAQTVGGDDVLVPLLNHDAQGISQYRFGLPVFRQSQSYRFRINAYEAYPFYVDEDKTILQHDNTPVIDKVPTSDGLVTIYNNLRAGSIQADTLTIDSTGRADYQFYGGDPNLASLGVKDFTMNVRFGAGLNLDWKWLGQPKMSALVLGGKQTGTNFVTAGPDHMLYVLRDPPGNRSFSYAEKGISFSDISTYSGTLNVGLEENLSHQVKNDVITFQGIGGGVITEVSSVGEKVGLNFSQQAAYTGTRTKLTTTTFTEGFQTSDDPDFVGPDGDLFVGYATNLTFGETNNITIMKTDELTDGDSVIYRPQPANGYVVVIKNGINIGHSFRTLFAYPQKHITDVLIPDLEKIRNSLLYPKSTSPQTAQALANSQGRQIYVSKWDPTDKAHFGKSNTDPVFGEAATDAAILTGDGPGYRIYFPAQPAPGPLGAPTLPVDSVQILNQDIAGWENRLRRNEEIKVKALGGEYPLIQNFSFHAGSPVSYSAQYDHLQDTTNTFNVTILNNVVEHTSLKVLGIGFEVTLAQQIGTTQEGTYGGSIDTTKTFGFTLAADGTSEYLSVDVDRAEDSSFVFVTKGGVTGCPYEGAVTTQYYQKGSLIGQPTMKIEVPSIDIDHAVVNDVPASRSASYTLLLRNESEAQLPGTFTLTYADIDSVQGATIAVDGSSLAGGRTFVVPFGETIRKVLTLTKGPEAMNYENIPIILRSSCDAERADTVLISAHFIPSCSDIHIAEPLSSWILNTASPENAEGNRYLPVILDRFDVNNSLFDHIDLQYKASASGQWRSVAQFFADPARYQAAQGNNKMMITDPSHIQYQLEMNETAFSDQPYDIRALSVCKLGGSQEVTTTSNVVSGLKDTYQPRQFGVAQPANGILGVGDDIRINFNEKVAAGLLSHDDISVTGIRNGAPNDHSVSVRLDGKNDALITEFSRNLSGRDFTVDMWVDPDRLENQVLFSQGNLNTFVQLSYLASGKLQINMSGETIESDPLEFEPGSWANVALVYHDADSTVSAFYNAKEVIHSHRVARYQGTGPFVLGSNIDRSAGFFAGKMHDVQVWTRALQSIEIQQNSQIRLSGAENGLLAYYPMTEGEDTIALDKAHGNHALLHGSWSTPPGKALSLDGTGYMKISSGTTALTNQMDYTLGLWFKGVPGQQDATLLSNGRGDGQDPGGSRNIVCLGFEKGLLTFRSNGLMVQAEGNYLDNQWHYVAVNVNRVSGTAQLFVDGTLKNYFDALSVGGFSGAFTYLGARAWFSPDDATTPHIDQHFTGQIDDYRLWNSYLNQAFLEAHHNVRLQGDEFGLLAYYPFEHYESVQNNQELHATLEDQKIQEDPSVVVPEPVIVGASFTDETAPIKDRGPVDNLAFDYVVNDDALIINLLEPAQAIDKTVVTFQVKRIFDEHGNTAPSYFTWSAYIDQNPLRWSDDALELSKAVYQPMQFKSSLVNSSGIQQPFRLDNLPPWLEASPMSGTVGPEGRQEITFTVNQGLNVGRYDDIIEAANDQKEVRGLSLNLKVIGQTPDWTVDPADFAYNMTIYGKIRVAGIFSDNPDDMVAAFRNGRCVGVTHNTYFKDNDLWYVFLTVYGDTARYDDLEFRVWDAGKGKTYLATPSVTPLDFVNDTIYGTPGAPVVFDGKEMFFQDIPLRDGWNWISFNLHSPRISDIGAMLANGDWRSGDEVKNNLHFDQYSSQSGWVGTLGSFDNLSLFMLRTSQAQTLSVSGVPVDPLHTDIALGGHRWSYISYLPQGNLTVGEALAGYEAGAGDIIKSQTGFAMYDPRNGWVGNLTYLEPGKGYMLYRAAMTDTVFHYPAVSGILRESSDQPRWNPQQSPVAGNFRYADNMTMVAVPDSTIPLKPGDQILVYAGGELRGAARATRNALTGHRVFLLNIAGKDPQPLRFSLVRLGREIAQSGTTIDYAANSRWGSLQKPFMLEFRSSAFEAVLSPNPFRHAVTMTVTLSDPDGAARHRMQFQVYDLTGKLRYGSAGEYFTGPRYQTQWQGHLYGGGTLSPGAYVIRIAVDGQARSFKVIKFK
jgi:hypothetical protein